MEDATNQGSPLKEIEGKLRDLTPAKLYADAWINPDSRNLTRVFNHLRSIYRVLNGYLPREVVTKMPESGINQLNWDEGTIMFTDLSGFTPLLEENANHGKEGANALLAVLNDYFSSMIQIISKSGGNLLEFTGDALLVQFPIDRKKQDTQRAIRAGLRMQREMKKFNNIDILGKTFSLKMRIGIHVGKFLVADIGTPLRMEHVLLGSNVLSAKLCEGNGRKGSVSLTKEARKKVEDVYKFEKISEDYSLVVDNFTEDELGDYDILPSNTRMASMILLDASREGIAKSIEDSISMVRPLASYIPVPILKMLVENTSSRGVAPDFPEATLLFVNLLGMPEKLKNISEEDLQLLISEFSRVISLTNAEIQSQGGVMKKVTYHHAGPDIMAFFGVPNSHTNNTVRAVNAAYQIGRLVKRIKPIKLGDQTIKLTTHIGLTQGKVFAGEVGDRQGRREFNVMGNTVNTAARLMDYANENQIIVSENVFKEIKHLFDATPHIDVSLKGKSEKLNLYEIGKKIR